MASLIVAAPPATGEFRPLLQIAEALAARGHRVTFLGASRFEAEVEAAGARFVALTGVADWDDPVVAFPRLRDAAPGADQLNVMFGEVMGSAIPSEHDQLQELLDADPEAVLIANSVVFAAWPTALGAPGRRPRRWVTVVPNPIFMASADTSPLGPLLPSGPDGDAATANLAAAAALDEALEPARASIEALVRSVGATQKLPGFFEALFNLPDAVAALTVPGVEFERSDAPASFHLVGALPAPAPPGWQPPRWWGDLDDGRPVVVVTQGTFANDDLKMLVRPTLDALAEEDMLVVAALGRSVDALTGPVPANARVEEFLPFGHLLPRTDVFVTNGGYGATQQALAAGTPVVVAGDSEDKLYVAARVSAHGLGRDLGTARPRPAQVREAVTALLGDEEVHAAVRRISEVYAHHDALGTIERLALD